jgi:hypothetical protein
MKRPIISIVTAMAAVAAIGLLAPRRLASQYATPVNVMNSKSGPALIRDTDNARRTPYVSSVNGVNATLCNPQCPFTAVPTNMRLVITHFDALINVPNSSGSLAYILLYQPGNSFTPNIAYPEFTCGAPGSNVTQCMSSRAVEYYVEAGSMPTVLFVGANGPVSLATATLTGYLIDCTNGCAPIVH